MIPLLLGVATLIVMMAALGMFSRAQVATIKEFGIWIAAIGGLALACLLFLTGRGALAIGALAMLGPSVWGWMRPRVAAAGPQARKPPAARGWHEPGGGAGGARLAARRKRDRNSGRLCSIDAHGPS